MRILGIGSDIVKLSRIARLLDKFGEKFVQRILSGQEQARFKEVSSPISFLAKRFAAKEAVAKALGTGIGLIAFNEIDVSNLPTGQPLVSLIGKGRERFSFVKDIMLSLADEKDFALAFAVILDH